MIKDQSLRLTLCGTFVFLVSFASPLFGQLSAEIDVEVSQGADGFYTYDYTVSTSILSSLPVDWFQLDTVNADTVVEGDDAGFFVRTLDAPEGWVGEYQPYKLEYDADFNITGIVTAADTNRPVPNNDEVIFLAGDGLICDHPAGGVQNGSSETFTIRSVYGPEERNYTLGKTDQFCDFLGFNEGLILAPSTPPVGGPSCDFDGDGDCDLVDIDALGVEIAAGTNDLGFDLNSDSMVDANDLDLFLADENVRKINGDADFNNAVEFADFLTLSGNFSRTPATWSQGDFVPNGVVEFADFLVMSGNFGAAFANGPPLNAAAPEPASGVMLVLATAGLLSVRRRRESK